MNWRAARGGSRRAGSLGGAVLRAAAAPGFNSRRRCRLVLVLLAFRLLLPAGIWAPRHSKETDTSHWFLPPRQQLKPWRLPLPHSQIFFKVHRPNIDTRQLVGLFSLKPTYLIVV